MVEFGGWEMPLSYRGVLDEHRACRARAVVFDVSHLGTVRVRGTGARDLLQWAFTNDLGKIAPGRAQYTHLLDERDAHVVDDVIVWWLADDDFAVMPNASNTGPLLAVLRDAAPAGCEVDDVTATRAVLAVQGPEARALLAAVEPGLAGVARFRVAEVRWNGVPCVVAGTGYTGEDGVEIQVPADRAGELWDAVLAAGIEPAGLGARDTLRLEAGLPLHGHELGPGITPLQAGLGWVVAWDKGEFRGRTALLAERERGVTRRLFGLVVPGRRPPREGARVLLGGREAGTVTSGNFSPTLRAGIALAFLPPDTQLGTPAVIDVRGHELAGTVTGTRFLDARRG